MGHTALAFLAVGAGIGVASGMLGIGGAVILVPALTFGFGFTHARAQGTSIGALLPPVGLFAAIQYYRNGLLDVRAAALVACGFLFGALAGAAAVPHVPRVWLKRAFATLLVYVAAQLVFADPNRRMGAVRQQRFARLEHAWSPRSHAGPTRGVASASRPYRDGAAFRPRRKALTAYIVAHTVVQSPHQEIRWHQIVLDLDGCAELR